MTAPPPLCPQVILVPHSHNDPGWLLTYEGYFHFKTRNILNNMVSKLQALPNMTFIWTEVSFFSQWWESAHPSKRHAVKKLLEDGRLEMTTGGWVMTDEANSHVFAMVDQLIEGHQWVKNNLGVTPHTGWSIDPFGHGATVPYLLKASGVSSGAVIQRVHYAWKQWLAERQMGDFMWRQNWDTDGRTDLLTHNQPFDIYSIKHSCGPHPQICLNFDFRKIPGEYTEYSLRAVPIDDSNVKQKAELLLQQYGRTGSLFPHNVVLMPLGDDFRYSHEQEWDQQYEGYSRLADYINKHKAEYHAEVVFGTPADYFAAVRERTQHLDTLKGDFFVYSDIFSEGRPAYWSGYFTTRPYWKILDRELEASLRSAEILYALTLNRARRSGFNYTVKLLERDYEKLIKSRRNLALFQHHDAITGTSKATVMHDYALKMFESLQETQRLQRLCVQTLLVRDEVLRRGEAGAAGAAGGSGGGSSSSRGPPPPPPPRAPPSMEFIQPDTDRESYEKLARRVPVELGLGQPRTVVLFNSLAQHRQDVVKLTVTTPDVRVLDPEGNVVPCQVNPLWNLTASGGGVAMDDQPQQPIDQDPSRDREPHLHMNRDSFELMFVAELPPLALVSYRLERMATKQSASRAKVYCAACGRNPEDGTAFVSPFDVKGMQAGDIQLENYAMKLLFDGASGFLKAITRKAEGQAQGHTTRCKVQFSAYPSAQFHSGAYLFMPDPSREGERDFLEAYVSSRQVVITSGPIASEVTVFYGRVLAHSVRLYHAQGALGSGVYIENVVDFESPPKNRETELFMRLVTDVANGDPPELYTDLNGFQMQRRVKVDRIGIEGNYFPVTTQAYIQDSARRLSLLLNHAQGAASWQPGWLEVMLDRRTLYDDSRGMGEGIVDNKQTLTKFWLLLEDVAPGAPGGDRAPAQHSRPSLYSNHMSNSLIYPTNVYVVDSSSAGEDLAPSSTASPLDGVAPAAPVAASRVVESSLHKQVLLVSRPFPCDVHLLNLRTLADSAYAQFPSTSALMLLHRQGFACDVGAEVTLQRCSVVADDEENNNAVRREDGDADSEGNADAAAAAASGRASADRLALHPRTAFSRLRLESVTQTSLTGLHHLDRLGGLDQARMKPMELLTLNLTFSL
ncbi:hypothetical protein ONE63_006991 [Megalurothrips usitatus]|uniref:Alpha-mannosidase n=1 Tax=Megalurothrips usitatus TaxID=439358 RepID=A0AAV7XUR2_9NEOP|nr:hypothetical protein ONE63_006991 [Megalurothrips usitatus]